MSHLDIFGHDGDSLSMHRAQVGVFEKTDQASFADLLQSYDGRALETEIGLEIPGDLTNQTLEWKLPNEKLGRSLVTSEFTESYSNEPVTMGLLYSAGG